MKRLYFLGAILLVYGIVFTVAANSVRLAKIKAPVEREIFRIRNLLGKNHELKPLVLGANKRFDKMAASGIPDTVVVLNQKGEFALLLLDSKGNAGMKPIIPGYPGTWGELYSDDEHGVLWLVSGNKIYFLDLKEKAKGIVEAPDKTTITSIFVIDPATKRIGLAYYYEIYGEYPGASRFMVYDLQQGKIIPELDNFYKGEGLHPFSNRQVLMENKESWTCSNLSLDKLTANPLTGFLTQHGIKIPEMFNPFIPAKRIMAGWDFEYNLMLIYWNESLKPAGMTGLDPYLGQEGVFNTFPENFSFSPGGGLVENLA